MCVKSKFISLKFLLILLFITFSALLGKGKNETPKLFKLDGKTFKGDVRASGILSIFKGRNTLKFNNGLFTWSDGSSIETGKYQIIKIENMIIFTAKTPLEYDGGTVKWVGFYDGKRIFDVQASWVRGEKGHFFHNLLLPDIVKWNFIPDKN
jgi:hypothetical protein